MPNQTSAALLAPVFFDNEVLEWDDATWILTSVFLILTMKTGEFEALFSVCSVEVFQASASWNQDMCSRRNVVNQLMMNVVDILFSGLSYWMFGHGFIYGESPGTSPFAGIGAFFFGLYCTFISQTYIFFQISLWK